jgi:HEAT repeat protein
MTLPPRRLLVLIGVGLVMLAFLLGRWLFFGDEAGDSELAGIRQLQEAGDVEALAERVRRADAPVAGRAVEALGRVGSQSLGHIEAAMRDPRPLVREKAATAFARVARYDNARSLARMAAKDESANVRAAAVSGLGKLAAFDEMDTILAAMNDPDLAVRRRAARAARKIACAEVGYDPEAPLAERRVAIERMRGVWEAGKGRAAEYWKMLHEKHPRLMRK